MHPSKEQDLCVLDVQVLQFPLCALCWLAAAAIVVRIVLCGVCSVVFALWYLLYGVCSVLFNPPFCLLLVPLSVFALQSHTVSFVFAFEEFAPSLSHTLTH